MALSQPPPDLAQAIANASRKYGVPPDVLTGIWRVESGSSYPNRYVNSSGYGGLFGTTDWNGSPQSQADLAAKILAQQIRQNNGDVAAALYAYSGKGYRSVPGQQAGGGGMPNPMGGSLTTPPPRPADTQGYLASYTGGTAQGVQYNPISFLGGVGSWFGGIFHDAVGGIEGPFKAAKDVFTAFVWLANPLNWLRGFEAIVGFAMLMLGLYFLGQEDGSEQVAPGELLQSPGKLARGAGKGTVRAAKVASSASFTGKAVRKSAKVVK